MIAVSDLGQRAAQVVRRERGPPRDQLRDRRRRGLRPARPERRRQDDDGRDPRGLPPARRRHGHGARRGPAARPTSGAAGSAIVPQSGDLFPNLTVLETSRCSPPTTRAPRDVDDVVRLVGLEEKRDARYARSRAASGGASTSASALVGDPELMFLDEPTTGFDPAARRAAWETIRSLRDLGKTILLTTHYIEEAQQLADRVAVLREGEIVASARPAELIGAAPGYRDPLPPRRRGGRRRDRGADARAARADRARRWPRAASSRSSRCAGRRSRRSTWR